MQAIANGPYTLRSNNILLLLALTPTSTMRYSDIPISRPSEDLLGRVDFALSIARSIDHLKVVSDGFVIGLVGGWGSGKTSVIRLVCRYLMHLDMERWSHSPQMGDAVARPMSLSDLEDACDLYERALPQIPELLAESKNPTLWSVDERRGAFARALGSQNDGDAADRYFQLSARFRSDSTTVVVTFSPWLIAGRVELATALLAELGRSLDDKLGPNIRQAFGALLQRLSEFMPVAGAGLDMFAPVVGPVVRAVGGWTGGIGNRMATGATLDEIRQRLRTALSELSPRRILVIIDDLDRLTPKEALQMVSLVKSLGDLPNTIYLLGYDEDRLAKLVRAGAKVPGKDFLDKIIQYRAHLPLLDEDDLALMLNTDLDDLLGDLDDDEADRLQQIWFDVLRKYVSNPRAVKRFINGVSMSLASLSGYVDRIDLVLLEAIRTFEPEVYELIRRQLWEFVDQ